MVLPLFQTSVSSLRIGTVDSDSLQEYYQNRANYVCEHVATERFYPLRVFGVMSGNILCLLFWSEEAGATGTVG